jgi:hypothetical protein
MAVFKGDASAFVTLAIGGTTRRFSLRTVNSDGAPSDRSTWQVDPGGSVTLYFRTEGTGPDAPTNVILRVYYETGTGTVVRTLHSGASPSTGTSYTFYGTDTGLVGGSPRAGVVRLFVQAQRTGSTGGTGDYTVNSDGLDTHGALLSDGGGDMGALRVRCNCNDLTVSAYPSGSRFAIGPNTDESFTLTLTHTQKYADRNLETVQFRVLTSSDVIIEAGPSQELGTGTSTTAAFVVDMTYPQSNSVYGAEVTSLGNSALLPSEKWTELVDNGVNLTQVDAFTIRRSSFFNVDTTVSATLLTTKVNTTDANKVPTGALSQQFFVGADVCYFNTRIANARGEYLDGMAVQLLVKLAGTNEQGPFTGLQTQTSSSRLGWLSSTTPFYTVNVVAPAADRVLSALYTRGAFSITQTVTVTFSPAYTGNLQLNVGVYRAVGSNVIRVNATPILLEGANQLKLSQGTPAGTLDVTPKCYLYEIPATGIPVLVDSQVMTRTVVGSDDDFETTLTGLNLAKQYFVSLACQFNGGQVARNMTVPAPGLPFNIVIGAGPTIKGEHFRPGMAFQAGVNVVDTTTGLMVNVDGVVKVAICRSQDGGANIGRAEFLDSDLVWKRADNATIYFWPCTETIGSSSKVYLTSFTPAQTLNWGTYDIFVVGQAIIGGVVYHSSQQATAVGPYSSHGMGS